MPYYFSSFFFFFWGWGVTFQIFYFIISVLFHYLFKFCYFKINKIMSMDLESSYLFSSYFLVKTCFFFILSQNVLIKIQVPSNSSPPIVVATKNSNQLKNQSSISKVKMRMITNAFWWNLRVASLLGCKVRRLPTSYLDLPLGAS